MTAAPAEHSRRRIDRMTAPGFLAGVGDRPLDEVRAMRDECREEEARLSFARRVLQGRLDIVRASVERRVDGAGRGYTQGDLLQELPEILADVARPSAIGDAHIDLAYDPEHADERREEETLLVDSSLGRLPDLDDAELLALLERLSDEERRVSDVRRRVLDALDLLQADLVRRYAADSSTVSGVVSSLVRRVTHPG